ncbi:MAG: aldo/keto reductase [Chloroflexi bacterium]|nr:aldo/keto reductase [Chloroflexota bacterium]
MRTLQLGVSDLIVPRIALGCMRLSQDRAEALRTIRTALDAGITFFDHADIYQRGRAEETFAAIWEEAPHLRQSIYLESKCGIRVAGDTDPRAPFRYDFSYEHIISAVEGSLRRLKTDYLDVLLLHRPDALMEPEEVARAFDELHATGKVRWFGVSNHTPGQIQLLQRWVNQPLIANQLQLSLEHTNLIDEGIWMNRSDLPEPSRGEGTLDFCRLHNITIQAWSPLAGGRLGGRRPEHADPRLERTSAVVAEMAAEKGISPEAILVAWILRHPARILPIIGTMNPERIANACRADEIELTREEWYRLYEAGRGVRVP